jgi:hypothetical protein
LSEAPEEAITITSASRINASQAGFQVVNRADQDFAFSGRGLRRKPQPGSQSTARKWSLADRDREHRQQTERLEVLITIEQHFRTIGNISEIS